MTSDPSIPPALTAEADPDVMWLVEVAKVGRTTYFPGWVNVRHYPKLREFCVPKPPETP